MRRRDVAEGWAGATTGPPGAATQVCRHATNFRRLRPFRTVEAPLSRLLGSSSAPSGSLGTRSRFTSRPCPPSLPQRLDKRMLHLVRGPEHGRLELSESGRLRRPRGTSQSR